MTDNANVGYYPGIPLDAFWEQRDQIGSQSWIVDNLLPVGFSILAGREKTGKSILTFGSIAIPVALGTKALQEFTTNKGVVLYFALEESAQTIRDRLEQMFGDGEPEWTPPSDFRLYLSDGLQTWSENSINDLERIIQDSGHIRLVVIDTLGLIAPSRNKGDYSDPYNHEYKVGSQLQTLALRYGIAIVAIHHTTKMHHQNIFDAIAGTAFTKACETMIVLEAEGSSYKLHVRGRSIPTSCHKIEMDRNTLLWTYHGEGSHGPRSRASVNKIAAIEVQDIFLTDSIHRHKDLVGRFQEMGSSEGSLNRWLKAKLAEGSVTREASGAGYRRTATDPPDPLERDPKQLDLLATVLLPSTPSIPVGDGSVAPSQPPPSLLPIDNGGGSKEASVLPPSELLTPSDGGSADRYEPATPQSSGLGHVNSHVI
jgi:hypothetical protein